MIGSQMTAQFLMASKLQKPPSAAGGAMRSTLKRSLPFSRMNELAAGIHVPALRHGGAGAGREAAQRPGPRGRS